MVIRTFLLPRVCTLDADARRELVILGTSRFLRLLSHDAAAAVSAVRGGMKPGHTLPPALACPKWISASRRPVTVIASVLSRCFAADIGALFTVDERNETHREICTYCCRL